MRVETASPETGLAHSYRDAVGVGQGHPLSSPIRDPGLVAHSMRACMGKVCALMSGFRHPALFTAPLFITLLPAMAVAQETSLEETLVTATRTPLAYGEVDAPFFVIDRDAIERSLAPDVAELLRLHAGMEIARTGGPGQQTSLFTRGTESNHTVVLVDGVRINPGSIGGAALQNIAPESIERIEVVKGPRSALYGTEAIGGVVNIITAANAREGVSGYASAGRYDTYGAGLAGGWKAGERAHLGAGIDYSESKGFPPLVADDVDRGYDNLTLNLSGAYDFSDEFSLRARGWRTSGNTQYTTTVFDPETFEQSLAPVDQDFENASYALEALWNPRDSVNLRVALTRAEDEIEQNQDNNGGDFPPFDYTRTQRNGLELQGDFGLGGSNILTAGAVLTKENVSSLSFGTGYDVDIDVNQFFVQDRFSFGRQDLLAAIGYVDHETFGDEVTWNAQYGISIGEGLRVTLGAGKAFRAPDATDLYGFGGNPDLDPEVSTQYEIGLRQSIGEQHAFFVNAFRNDIDDLIIYVFDPLTFDGINENVERARIEGIEAGYAFEGEQWHVRAEATWQDPVNRDTGERLLRRARENYLLAVDRVAGRFAIGADVAFAGNRKDSAFPSTITLDSYTLVNATAKFAITKNWWVQARLENAFDEDYTLVNGYRTAGRGLSLATRVTLD